MQNTVYKRTENRRSQILVLITIVPGNKALIIRMLSFKSLNKPCFLFFHYLFKVQRRHALNPLKSLLSFGTKLTIFFPQMRRPTTPSFNRFEIFSQIICYFLISKGDKSSCYSTCVGLLSVNFDIVIVTSKTTQNVTEGS